MVKKSKEDTILIDVNKQLDTLGEEKTQRIVGTFKRVLKEYPNDMDFVIQIFRIVIDRLENEKLKNKEYENKIKELSQTLDAYTVKFTRKGYIFIYRKEGTADWEEKRYSEEFLKYREDIEDYFTGFDKNGYAVYYFPNDKEEQFLPSMLDDMKKVLSVDEAERLYTKLVEIEKNEKKEEDVNLIDKIRQLHSTMEKFPYIEKIIECLIKNKYDWVLTSDIISHTGIERQKLNYYLKILKKDGFVEQRLLKGEGLWRIKPIDAV